MGVAAADIFGGSLKENWEKIIVVGDLLDQKSYAYSSASQNLSAGRI